MVLTGGSSKPVWQLVELMSSVPIAPPVVPRPPRARPFRFSKTQTQAVIEAYEAGATMAALAKRYGVKRQTISELLKRRGVTIRLRRSMSQAEIGQAEQLYERGLSLQRIGDELGWDHKTVYHQLKKRGVVFRGPSDWKY